MPSQSLVKHRPPPPVYGTLLNNFPSYHHHIIPSSPPPPTPATDNDCAICLTPLHSHATLHLQCGHTWHLHCIREQIMRSQPTVSKPLTFSGIRCPICMQICRHQLIDKLVAPCEALLKKVACVALEQMTIDQTSLLLTSKGGHQVVELQQQQQQHRRQIITIDTNHISAEDQMLVDAYTFYMCAKCEQPYIAGISDCLDQYQNNNNNTNNNSNNNNNDNNSNTTTATTTIINNNNDIISVCDSSSISNLCTTCLLTSSPTSNPFSFAKPLGELCRSPHTHTPFFVWKCRFCCQPASVLCHNHTHLCKSCYERDTAVRNGMALKFPPKRCKGHGVCMNVHMEQNEYMHRNGPTIDCELLLYCAICESLPKCSGTSNSKGSGMKGHVGRSGNNNSRQNGRLVSDERRDGGGGGGETNQQKCQEMGQQINNHQSLIEQSSSNRAKKMMSQSGSDMVVKSPNMLFNPCGDKGMDGWISPYHHVDQTPSTQGGSRYTTNLSKASSTSSSFFTSGQHHKDNKIPKRLLGQHTSSSANPLGQWTVEHPQTPSSSSSSPSSSLLPGDMTNFVLSSQQACMAQCVDVSNFIPTRYSSAIIRIELSFHFRFSIDTSTMSSVQLIAAVYDSRMNEIASCKKSSVVDADDTDTDGWQIVSHCFAMSRQSRPRFVVLAVMGEQIQQKQQHQREYKRFVWGRHHAAQQQQQQQQRKNNVVKVKHCAVNVFYRNNHRKLFYRDAFDRVCLRLIGPKQPIFQLFVDDAREDEEEDERQKMQKEKERRLQDVVRRGVQPEHLAAANITLPTTQSLQNQQPRLPIVQHDDVAEHLFHQRSFSRISSNTSLSFRSVGTAMSTASSSSGRVNSSSSAEKDRHFLRRGRLSRSFYRGRYRQYD